MKPSKKNNSTKSELLNKYISGAIGNEEMHLLNQYALDDDFLFESLEGLSEYEDSNSAVLKELNAKLKSKSKRKRPVYWYWAGAAASILIIVVSIIMLQPLENEIFSDSLAMDVSEEDQNELTESEISLYAESESSQEIVVEKVAAAPKTNGNLISKKSENNSVIKENSNQDNAIAAIKEQVKFDKVDELDREVSNADIALDNKTQNYEPAASAGLAASKKPMTELAARSQPILEQSSNSYAESKQKTSTVESISPIKINGVVSTLTGEPLTGSKIYAPEFNLETETDKNGKFNFVLPGTPKELKINYNGYIEKSITFEAPKELNIVLMKKEQSSNIVEFSDASPLNNSDFSEFNAFKEYAEKNFIVMPSDGAEQLTGTVEFEILSDGKPSNIEFSDSLGNGYEQEVFRLLTSYSNWTFSENVENNKKTIRITISIYK